MTCAYHGTRGGYRRDCPACVELARERAIRKQRIDASEAAKQQAPDGGPTLRQLRDANQERIRAERVDGPPESN